MLRKEGQKGATPPAKSEPAQSSIVSSDPLPTKKSESIMLGALLKKCRCKGDRDNTLSYSC